MARTKQTARRGTQGASKVLRGPKKKSREHKSQRSEEQEKKKRKWGCHTLALRQCRKLQKETNRQTQRATFERMLRYMIMAASDETWQHGDVEIRKGRTIHRYHGKMLGKGNIRISAEAIEILHIAAEEYLTEVFQAAGDALVMSKNVTLMPRHMEFVVRMLDKNFVQSRGQAGTNTLLLGDGLLRSESTGKITNANDRGDGVMYFSRQAVERSYPGTFPEFANQAPSMVMTKPEKRKKKKSKKTIVKKEPVQQEELSPVEKESPPEPPNAPSDEEANAEPASDKAEDSDKGKSESENANMDSDLSSDNE